MLYPLSYRRLWIGPSLSHYFSPLSNRGLPEDTQRRPINPQHPAA